MTTRLLIGLVELAALALPLAAGIAARDWRRR
jgi:hypothetical protein